MMALRLTVLFVTLATVVSGGGCASHPVPVLHKDGLTTLRYSRYALRGQRSGFITRLFRSNYLEEPLAFPPASQVEIEMFSDVRIDLKVNGIPCQMFSPDVPFPTTKEGIDQFLEKHFARSRDGIGPLNARIKRAIKRGRALKKMSKEEVLLSLGYPSRIDNNILAGPLTRDRILGSNQWIYKHTEFAWIPVWRTYQFDLQGLVLKEGDLPPE